MKKIIIILSICLYTAIIAYIFDNVGTQMLIRSGGTYQLSRSTSDGLQCKTEYVLDLNHYQAISKLIKASTLKERYHIKGLIEMRVDMIVISVLLVDFIIKELNISNIRVSTFSLKEGVISEKLGLTIS